MQLPINTICYEDGFFRIQHCGDCFIAGHLVIFPKKEVLSLNELSLEALEKLGQILNIAHKAVAEVIHPERVYTLSFGEVLPLIHFHIFPRTSEILSHYKVQNSTEQANGSLIFDWARQWFKDKPSDEYPLLIEAINQKFKKEMQ